MAEVYGLHCGDGVIRYVGMTSRATVERFKEHLKASRSGKKLPVYDWMRKHENIIEFVVIKKCESDAEAKQIEVDFIAKFGRDNLLNCTDGGDGVTGWTESARLRMSKIKRNQSSETKSKISAAKKGKPLSEAHKKKLSEARIGLKPSLETRAKLSAAKQNQSAETKAKIAQAQKARHAAGLYSKRGN